MTHAVFDPSVWGITFVQLLLATVCGGVIGYQRELQESPAGFRTHVLVCVGAAVYMLVSLAVAGQAFDPGRIAAQVASGMGFLGAGTIIKQGSIVRGLTTAASLWAVAAIGLAIGNGSRTLAVAVLGTLMVFLALSFLRTVERFITRFHLCYLLVTAEDPRQQLEPIRQQLTADGIDIRGMEIQDQEGGLGVITIEVRVITRDDLDRAAAAITRMRAIRNVRWDCR